MRDVYLLGKQRFIEVSTTSTGAGATNADLKPSSAGVLWIVQMAYTIISAGKALTVQTKMVDPDATVLVYNASLADLTAMPWDGRSASVKGMANGMLALSQTAYLRSTMTADAVGQVVYWRAAVLEFLGPFT